MNINPEISAQFTYTTPHISPTLSSCGTYIAYIQANKLIIKKARSLRNYRVFQIRTPERAVKDGTSLKSPLKISLLKWEIPSPGFKCEKLALLIDSLNLIQIYQFGSINNPDEYIPIIIQSSWEGIESFEWISPAKVTVETAYMNCKQLLVFSKDLLKSTLYSLDCSQPVEVILYPKSASVLAKPFSEIWCVVTRKLTTDSLVSFINNGSTSQRFYNFDLSGQLDAIFVKWSLSGKWLFVSDSVLDGFKISVWNLLGLSNERNKPIYQFENSESLGLSNYTRGLVYGSQDKDLFILGDYENNILIFDVEYLRFSSKLLISSTIASEDVYIWKQIYDSKSGLFKFRRQRAPYDIPSITLPEYLNSVEVLDMSKDNSKLIVKSKSMPSALFVYDMTSKVQLLCCIIVISSISSIEWHPVYENLLMIVSDFTIVLYCDKWKCPLTVKSEMKIKQAKFISANLNKFISIMINDQENFVIVKCSLTSDYVQKLILNDKPRNTMNSNDIALDDTDLLREGSPILIEDDENTNVRDIVNGVQQNEWALPNVEITDTFLNKKIKDEPMR